MNFRFSNLLGAPYRGGNILIHGNELLSPVGNRVSQVDLVKSVSQTLPFENLKQVQTLCISADGTLLLSVDEDGKALLINKRRKALLHHFSFKGPVSVAKFSPDGQYLAAGVGRLVQVWKTPSTEKQMSPMQLHRTYGQCHSDVLDLDWSHDSHFIAVASKDLVARVFSLHPIPGYEPPMLAGHKDAIVSVFFTGPQARKTALVEGRPLPVLCTLSRDGALYTWGFTPSKQLPSDRQGTTVVERTGPVPKKQRLASGEEGLDQELAKRDAAAVALAAGEHEGEEDDNPALMPHLAGGKWSLSDRNYLNQRHAKVSSAEFHRATGVLVVGTSTGLMDLYQLPNFEPIQALSVSRERITSLTFNENGDWIAVGCAKLGQLLVWEWRSESYILKQQGHYHDIGACAFSPDGALVATAGDDRKVKLFQVASGFCFVTFTEHAAPVTAVTFIPNGNAVLSASLDGTVRAFDLLRYRNFRTLTSPQPTQFVALAVDPAGEVVVAGTADTFQIYVWSLKTGRLLDILAGHEGPVCCLAFNPVSNSLASGSWDKTVRTWDVFAGKTGVEALQHSHDVLALAYRPDGKQLASATLNGDITFWDPIDGVFQGVIEGRRDVKGGRLEGDRRAAGNLASGAAFRSLAYSADGSFLIAGGASRYVIIYDVAERVMLRRFALTSNRSLDGVLDTLNSKNVTDAGPLQLIDHDSGGEDDRELLPASVDAAAAQDVPGTGGLKKKPPARTRCLALSPTNRCWAAATTEGLTLYSLDDDMFFDPTDLTEDLTPAACRAALRAGSYVRAALIALRLKDSTLLRACVFGTPPAQVSTVASALPAAFAPQLLVALSEYLTDSAHLEFVLQWTRSLCISHGPSLESASGGVGRHSASMSACLPALRNLHKALTRTHEDLAGACEGALYTLDYLLAAGQANTTTTTTTEQEGEPHTTEQDTDEGQPTNSNDSDPAHQRHQQNGAHAEDSDSGDDDTGHAAGPSGKHVGSKAAKSKGKGEGKAQQQNGVAKKGGVGGKRKQGTAGEGEGGEGDGLPLVSVGRVGGSRVAGVLVGGEGDGSGSDGQEGSDGEDGSGGDMPGWG